MDEKRWEGDRWSREKERREGARGIEKTDRGRRKREGEKVGGR